MQFEVLTRFLRLMVSDGQQLDEPASLSLRCCSLPVLLAHEAEQHSMHHSYTAQRPPACTEEQQTQMQDQQPQKRAVAATGS